MPEYSLGALGANSTLGGAMGYPIPSYDGYGLYSRW